MAAKKVRWKTSPVIPNFKTDNLGSIFAASFAGLGILLSTRLDLHLSLHIIGIMLATLIAIISWRSYIQDRRPKICLLAFAFLFLDLHQLLELFESLGMTFVNISLPLIGIELIHAISFGTIIFLAAGILKKWPERYSNAKSYTERNGPNLLF